MNSNTHNDKSPGKFSDTSGKIQNYKGDFQQTNSQFQFKWKASQKKLTQIRDKTRFSLFILIQ